MTHEEIGGIRTASCNNMYSIFQNGLLQSITAWPEGTVSVTKFVIEATEYKMTNSEMNSYNFFAEDFFLIDVIIIVAVFYKIKMYSTKLHS